MVLKIHRMNMKNFAVYRSSAGSGKTYTLALHYIAMALNGEKLFGDNYYKHILAITFTNKATAEMKERILEFLAELSVMETDKQKSWEPKVKEIADKTGLSPEEIKTLSAKVFDSILHHYSDFSISTIDKFTYQLIRTFSKDLQLSENFELEMDNASIIQPAVARLISKVSANGGVLSDALIKFVVQKIDEGEKVDIEKDLQEFAENLFKEEAFEFIEDHQHNIAHYIQLKDNLLERKKNSLQKIKQIGVDVGEFFEKYGFTESHFIRKTFYNHFTQKLAKKEDKEWLPSVSLQDNIQNEEWYSKNSTQDIKALVDLHKKDLRTYYNQLMEELKEYFTVKAMLRNFNAIVVLHEIESEIEQYKKEKNIETISVFNKMIHDVVVKQEASFIYERIGQRFRHFLIDEFQDTSVLQWQNFLPLITNTLDDNKCMIVGDGKQAIYRWRNGEVQQFLKLPKIFKAEALEFKQEWEQKIESHIDYPKDNNINYRSKAKIVDFNNDFYTILKSLLPNELQGIYNDNKQNVNKNKQGGYVHLELVKDEDILNRMIEEVQKLKAENRYNWRDITVLCNTRKKVALVAKSLAEAQIAVISNEGLLLKNSDAINFLLAVLNFMMDETNCVAKANIVAYLYKRNLITDFHQYNLFAKQKNTMQFLEVLNKLGLNFSLSYWKRLPLYDAMERMIKGLKIKEDLFVQFFLDVVLKYTEKHGNEVGRFLQWWEENKEKQSIVVPDGTDAVQVMTVHKSKGLDFPVVMIPFNWDDHKSGSNIWVDATNQSDGQLKAALIRTNKELDYSHFATDNQKEKHLTLLDSLNKLYVATTRPQERLYIFAPPYPTNSKDDFETSGKINAFLHKYAVQELWQDGDAQEQHFIETKEVLFQLKKVEELELTNWEEIIALKTSSSERWDEKGDKGKDWGKLLHLALSKINSEQDIEPITADFVQQGICDVSKTQELNTCLHNLFRHKEFAGFFDEKWEVKTERAILLQGGEIYIPDRILFGEQKTIVLDYKTGAKDEKHQTQIRKYASVLHQMGNQAVEMYLIYTNEKELVYLVS